MSHFLVGRFFGLWTSVQRFFFLGLGRDRDYAYTESLVAGEIWRLQVLQPHERLTGSPTS
jgi:hypothetical protein